MRRIYLLFISLTLSLGCMAQGFPPYRSRHRPPQHRSGNRPMREVNPEYKMTAETFVADSLVSSEYTLNYYKKQYAAVGDTSKKPCLFVYLHGGGGRDGKDNRYIQHAAIHTLDKYLTEKGIYFNSNEYPCSLNHLAFSANGGSWLSLYSLTFLGKILSKASNASWFSSATK